MPLVLRVLAFFALAFGVALSVWPMLRWRVKRRRFGFWLSCSVPVILLLSPFVIGYENVRLRALACFITIELFFKTIDYLVYSRSASVDDERFESFATFLIPFPSLLVRFGQLKREAFDWSKWLVVFGGLVVFVLGFVVVHLVNRLVAVRSSFWLDHTIKFVVFVVTIEALGKASHALEHLVGYRTEPLIDNAFKSKTVGEFWYRYNTRVHGWLEHHVFKPSGGVRAPIRAVFATFFVSASFHEFMFGVATSRWDGYQFAFFMLQAPAVIIWRYLQKALPTNGWGDVVLRITTIIWMWATSVLFFHGVGRVFPFFYASQGWLP